MSDAPSAAPKAKKSVALSGVTAGNTALCTVGVTGNDLHYRGYDILEIANTCEFEEIAHLLVHGKLPTRPELDGYKAEAQVPARIAGGVRAALETLPAAAHPMDVLRTGAPCWAACCRRRTITTSAGARDIADQLIASFGSMLCYWYHYSHNGQRIHVETEDDSVGGHFLHLLHRRATRPFLGARHAHVADSVRRARVQCLYVCRAGHCRHGRGYPFVHHRRDRRPARTEARRRQRGRV